MVVVWSRNSLKIHVFIYSYSEHCRVGFFVAVADCSGSDCLVVAAAVVGYVYNDVAVFHGERNGIALQ